jgi:hypothetical protein
MTEALDLFAEFATDEKAEQEGVWRDYMDVKFLVARANNRKFRLKFRGLYRPHEQMLKKDTDAAEKKSLAIMAESMAGTILLDWKGLMIVEKGGKPVEFSVDNARKALMIPKVQEMVRDWSDDFESFKIAKESEEEKN